MTNKILDPDDIDPFENANTVLDDPSTTNVGNNNPIIEGIISNLE